MKPRNRRRHWWELQKAAKEHVEKMIRGFQNLPEDVRLQVQRLPRDFTCFHFSRKILPEEMILLTMPLALARPEGALEYVTLEIDRLILRRAGRVRYAR